MCNSVSWWQPLPYTVPSNSKAASGSQLDHKWVPKYITHVVNLYSEGKLCGLQLLSIISTKNRNCPQIKLRQKFENYFPGHNTNI